MKTMSMPSANSALPITIEKVLDAELADKCGLYARVTIPAGSILGYHEHHGNGESYFILSGEAVYDDNGASSCESSHDEAPRFHRGASRAAAENRLRRSSPAWLTC